MSTEVTAQRDTTFKCRPRVTLDRCILTKGNHPLFRTPNGIDEVNLRTYSEMSSLGVPRTPPHPPPTHTQKGGSVSEPSTDKPKTNFAFERGGWVQTFYESRRRGTEKSFTNQLELPNKDLDVSRSKSISNSVYCYAISQSRLRCSWGKYVGELPIRNHFI